MLMIKKSVLITSKHNKNGKNGKSQLVIKELDPESRIEMDEMNELDDIDLKSIFDSLASKKEINNSDIAKEFINEFYNR